METTEVINEEVNKVTANNSQNNDEVANTTTKVPDCVGVVESNQQETPASSNSKPRNSKEEKMRKKDDKSVDHVLKALNSLNTTEEKLAAMCKKYADLFDESRKVQLALKQTEKKCCTIQREKEQLQTEHTKAILTRSRLENLCRELQRQNKVIKDESLLKIREEEEKRKEVSGKFQTTLNEITTLMQQNNDKNMKLRDDNIDMTARLKSVCEQYELREQQVDKINKQMQLETQLADAKMAKAKMEMAADKEIMLRDKQQLLLELSQYQARCQEFQTTEINLRNQISMYDDKYDEFQKALARSNEVFAGFKGEMEKMSKKMCKLEKEVSTWKQRWEGSHKALLDMAEEKQKSDLDLNQSKRQLQTLQGLCRTLQGERTALLAKIKEQNSSDDNSTSVPNDVTTSSVVVDSVLSEQPQVNESGDGVDQTKLPPEPVLEMSSVAIKEESCLNSQKPDNESKSEDISSEDSLPGPEVIKNPLESKSATTVELETSTTDLVKAVEATVSTEIPQNTAITITDKVAEEVNNVNVTIETLNDTKALSICNGTVEKIKSEASTLLSETNKKVSAPVTGNKDGEIKENPGKKPANEAKKGKDSKKKKKNNI